MAPLNSNINNCVETALMGNFKEFAISDNGGPSLVPDATLFSQTGQFLSSASLTNARLPGQHD